MASLKDTLINGRLTLNNGGREIDDVQELLNKIKAVLSDTGWISCGTPTVENNPNTFVEYRVKNGVVFVRGSANSGVKIENIKIITNLGKIPESYRPKNLVYILGTAQNASGYEIQVSIQTNGDIDALMLHNSSATDYWKFDICYPLEDDVNL